MPDPQIPVPPPPPVTVTDTATPAPDLTQTPGTGDIPQNQPAPAPDTSRPAPTQQHPIKSALHGWQALMGSTTQYVQTPNGPQAVQVQNKPGQLFRSILAGAIMGGAAGGEHNDGSGAGYGSASRGANAVLANQQQQQQQTRQNAQQVFGNQLAANKDQREASAAETEDQVRKAQIAQANAETLKTNMLTQGASYELHQKVADADKSRISTYDQAGLKPVFEDIPESQMNDIIKNRPGASTMDWRHTGVKTVVDAQGNPSYEYTLSAYDPTQPLPLSKGTVDQWKKDGLFDYHPEYADVAKPGKQLTVSQFTALDRQAQQLYGQQLGKTKDSLETQHLQSLIDEAKSTVREHNAQTSLAGLSAQEKQEEISNRKAADVAWTHLAAVNNDPSKLTDPRDRIALAKTVAPALAELGTAIKTAEANSATDKDAATSLPGLWGQYTTLSTLASLGGPTGAKAAAAAASDPVKTAFAAVQNMDPGPAYEAVDNSTTLTPEQKAHLHTQLKQHFGEQNKETRSAIGNVVRGAVGLPPTL